MVLSVSNRHCIAIHISQCNVVCHHYYILHNSHNFLFSFLYKLHLLYILIYILLCKENYVRFSLSLIAMYVFTTLTLYWIVPYTLSHCHVSVLKRYFKHCFYAPHILTMLYDSFSLSPSYRKPVTL